MNYANISFRSLILRWRQYIALFLVSVFGTAVSLFLLFSVKGMLSALNEKARIYYGGDLLLLGSSNGIMTMPDSVLPTCRDIAGTSYTVTRRYEINAANTGAIFFEGVSARQRYVKGVDFTQEHHLFDQFYYVEGSASPLADNNGIIISEPIARQLGCHVGDEVTLMVRTTKKQTNTVSLVVQGIFRDSSIFGMYTSYVDLELLQNACDESPHIINRINFTRTVRTVSDKDLKQLYDALAATYPLYPLVHDKNDYLQKAHSSSDTMYGLFPLSANMDDIAIIIRAMKAVTGLVILVLILIIVIGIASTYKVIISKRMTEISIYKSLGMKRAAVYQLIGTEALSLLVTGSGVGVLISFGMCRLIRLVDFTGIPSFDIFLSGGILKPVIQAGSIFAICTVIIMGTLTAVLCSVWDTVRLMPNEVMETL